jgi:hypothetical protein
LNLVILLRDEVLGAALIESFLHEGILTPAVSSVAALTVGQIASHQALHARYPLHARTFLLGGFVSIENKESLRYLPELKVAGSIPVARSIFPQWAILSRVTLDSMS